MEEQKQARNSVNTDLEPVHVATTQRVIKSAVFDREGSSSPGRKASLNTKNYIPQASLAAKNAI